MISSSVTGPPGIAGLLSISRGRPDLRAGVRLKAGRLSARNEPHGVGGGGGFGGGGGHRGLWGISQKAGREGRKGAAAGNSRAAISLFCFPLFPGTRRRYLGIPPPINHFAAPEREESRLSRGGNRAPFPGRASGFRRNRAPSDPACGGENRINGGHASVAADRTGDDLTT